MIIECLVHATDATTVGNVAMARKGRRKGGRRRRQLQGRDKLKGESCENAFLRCCGYEQEELENEKMRIKGDVHILPTNLLEVGPVKTVCCQHRSLSAACNLLRSEAEDHWVHFDHAPSLPSSG